MDDNSIVYGGEYDKYHQLIDYMFKKIYNSGAKLVFFVRYIIQEGDSHDDSDIVKGIERYEPAIGAVRENKRIQTAFNEEENFMSRKDRRFFHNIHELCRKYGDIVVASKFYTQTVMRYAQEYHRYVLALIGYDTAFLAFDGAFEYWGRLDSDEAIKLLSVMYVDRDKLIETLRLSPVQMRLHCLLAHVDFLKLEEFSNNPAIFGECTESMRLFRFAWYIKQTFPNDDDVNLERMARDIYDYEYIPEKHLRHFEEQWIRLDSQVDRIVENQGREQRLIDRIDDPNYVDIANYCRTKKLLYIYSMLLQSTEIPIYFWPSKFLDFRRERSVRCNDRYIDVLIKMIGVIHKDRMNDRRPTTVTMFRRTLEDKDNESKPYDINYPASDGKWF